MTIENGLIKNLGFGNTEIAFDDDIFVLTDKKVYTLSQMDLREEDGVYVFFDDSAEFYIKYLPVLNTKFFKRLIGMKFKDKTTLLKISEKMPKAKEAFLYETFFNASSAVFLRNGDIGICMGFENPYFEIEDDMLYFEPSMILKENEVFECDFNFFGVYEIYGEKISPELNKTQMYINGRYHPRYRNPGEGTPLYFSEIYEFGRYTSDYFECDKKEFKFMVYDFFGNLPQRPDSEDMYKLYIEHIDSAVKLGYDTILLNPLFPNTIPNEEGNSVWELFPKNTYADKIFSYAREKGLKVGVYTGTAGNGRYGNSSMIGYADNKAWKKIDVYSNVSEENCIADDNFADWYIKVQINTIKKYGLDLWSWDPGPGHGFFCHNENHGHLAGKGAYKGFRNSLKVMKALKEEFPDLYYQGFHGNKEYGLWGFKYIDQHEAYWENEVYVMNPVYDDLSVDRVTADNIRQQSVWNYYFRFMPNTLNHGIAHRMVQANWMGLFNLDLVFDYTGYHYALMSSIAYGGPITNTIIPRNPEKIEGYMEFYKKWIAFAKDIFYLSSYAIPFGSQVGLGIDAVSKIKDNRGFIFIFNPFPEDFKYKFNLDRRIGFFENGESFCLDMIYPYNEKIGEFGYSQDVTLTIPAYECVVIKVSGEDLGIKNDETKPSLPRVLYKEGDKYSFFASSLVKDLLNIHKISQKEIAVQSEYSKKFNRINSVWTRPDRLWLFVKSENTCPDAEIYVNGKISDWQKDFIEHNELRVDGMIFSDITDLVLWDKENKIELKGFGETSVYLHYPKMLNEKIPETKKTMNGYIAEHLLKSDDIKILSAKINLDNVIIPRSTNILKVKVNLPREELEGVYASVPISIGDTGCELKRDMALEYKDGEWVKEFKSDERICLIIDDFKVSIWAVSKDKKVSSAYHMPIEWVLK